MENRLSCIFLSVLLSSGLSGCAWFHHDKNSPKEVVVEDPTAEPSIIEPQVARREIKTPKIKAKDFEVGVFFGALSIQDFGTNSVYGLRGAYHVTEDVFLEGYVGRSKAGTTSLEDTIPGINLLTDSERRFTYYDLDVGYNILPGEIFLGQGRAYNSALYATVGVGAVRFANEDRFALEWERESW
jgi:hypothetical protein